LNAYQLTAEEKFLDASAHALAFIQNHFIDRTHGAWFHSVNEDGTPRTHMDKANGYTCPYHNARMSLEIMKRLAYISSAVL